MEHYYNGVWSVLKIAFFTEAGSHRGYGHFIRSYTIYEEFKNDNSKFFLDSDLDFSHTHKDIIYFKWDTLEIHGDKGAYGLRWQLKDYVALYK